MTEIVISLFILSVVIALVVIFKNTFKNTSKYFKCAWLSVFCCLIALSFLWTETMISMTLIFVVGTYA